MSAALNNMAATNVGTIRFTVIIPAYNAAATIARTIRSVLAQSYKPYEIIVADDASSDATVEIVTREFATDVRLIKNTVNKGSSASRNLAMDVATGDYIAFVDADDYWHEHKLHILNEVLSKNKNIALIYHPYTQEDISTKDFSRLPELKTLPFATLLLYNRIATSCATIKNEPSFRFEPDMRYTEDYDLWLRIGYKRTLYFIDYPLTRIFRPFTSPGGISGNKWKMRKGEMKAQLRLLRLNPLFLFLLPLLFLLSLSKHVYKAAKTS